MTPEELKERTKQIAVKVVQLTVSFPRTREAEVLGRQLLRSGTSVGANYRAACRARSKTDFINKIGIVEEEADESLYWMEVMLASKIVSLQTVEPLMREMRELLAIFTASGRTAKAHRS